MPRAAFTDHPSIADKLRRLSDPSAYAVAPARVDVLETHMSYVFLVGERVYKLKKPARFAFLDFSTLPAREANCRAELSLNRRLAETVYLGVVPLTLAPSGDLTIGGAGEIVDWLVEMKRLPAALMLDRLIADHALAARDMERLAATLAGFYARAARTAIAPAAYVARFLREHAESRRVLLMPRFALDRARARALLDRLEAKLRGFAPTLAARVAQGRVVDGHGDLRPEHICLCEPIAIFDCLEFNDELRQVDPLDELAFLEIECARLGAAAAGAAIGAATLARLGDAPPRGLAPLYGACRAALRARLALAHLLDAAPRQTEKWEPLAMRYLALAEERVEKIG